MNRFTIPRDIYYGDGALDILKTIEGKKAALVIGGIPSNQAAPSPKLKVCLRKRAWKHG